MAEGYKPNAAMKSAARQALKWKKEGKAGGTAVGLARAHQIVNGETLSPSTVRRMYSFFSRHEVDKKAEGFSPGEKGYPSAGRVAWNLWGGDAGFAFARGHVKSMKKSLYDSVVDELTSETEELIINKMWQASQGSLSPFASSSSAHGEQSDNYLEHYVKVSTEENSPSISSMFSSDLFSEGGEKVTAEKTFDVGESATANDSYKQDKNTTEPDPQSELAIQKAEVPRGADDLEGKGTYSTTANTTEQAPPAGATTEPDDIHKSAETCPHCGQAMPVNKSDDNDEDDMTKSDTCPGCNEAVSMCKCGGMTKADVCPDCKEPMSACKCSDVAKSVEIEIESPEEEATESEGSEEVEKSTMKKSFWGNAFLPVD